MDLDKFIKLLAQTDGRDKIYKMLQNLSKILAVHYTADKATAKKYDSVSKSLGEGRSILRMVKWVNNVNKLQGYAAKWQSLTTRQIVEIGRVIGDFGYIFGDNVQYLCKYKVLPFDQKTASKNSKIFQFWGFFLATFLDLWSILELEGKQMEPKDKAKERKALLLSFVKNLCDALATLAAVGYLKTYYHPTGTFTGACGLTSGAIATYQNWTKLK